LGPILFFIYTASVTRSFGSHGFNVHAFADDLQAHTHCTPCDQDDAVKRCQNCDEDLSMWMTARRLRLNPAKTEFIWLGSQKKRAQIIQTSINLLGHSVTASSHVRDLGVSLDPLRTLNKHISKLVHISFFQLRQLRKCLTNALAAELVHAFVMCRFDNCNSIFQCLSETFVKRLQVIFNASAHVVTGTCRFDHITPVFKSLPWLSYPNRIKYNVLPILTSVLTYRCQHRLSPDYLVVGSKTTSIRPVAVVPGRRSLCSACQGDLLDPRFFIKTFTYAGPSAWNALCPA